MKIAITLALSTITSTIAFAPQAFGVRTTTYLNAEIRPKTEKAKELRFGKYLW